MSLLKNLEPFTEFQRRLTNNLTDFEHKASRVLTHSDCIYGIEVETETWRPEAAHQLKMHPYWHFTRDGSLRGDWAMEAVSVPMRGTTLVRAVRMLCSYLNEKPFSYRCSTHVHLNLLDLDAKQLPSLALTCLLTDNLLFTAGGGERRGNYNCRPASVLFDEVELLANLSYHLAAHDNLGDHAARGFGERDRYLGTNFAALFKFGTVEFRHFPGTTSAKKLIGWCNLIGDIYEFATHHNVNEIMDLADEGVEVFGTEVFGGEFRTLTYREVDEDWVEALDTAFHFTATLARAAAGRKSFHGLLEAEYVL